MQNRLDVDAIINQMINSGGRNVKIREKDISLLCKITREIFMEQPVFLELEAPIKICGKYIIMSSLRWRFTCRCLRGLAILP